MVGWPATETLGGRAATAHGQKGPLPAGTIRQAIHDLEIPPGLNGPGVRLGLPPSLGSLARRAIGIGSHLTYGGSQGARVTAGDVADGRLAEMRTEGRQIARDHGHSHHDRL